MVYYEVYLVALTRLACHNLHTHVFPWNINILSQIFIILSAVYTLGPLINSIIVTTSYFNLCNSYINELNIQMKHFLRLPKYHYIF